MKYLITIILVALVIVSCQNQKDDVEVKRNQLQKYKQQVHNLNEKIKALESEIKGSEEAKVVNVKVTNLQPITFEHFVEVNGEVEAENNVDVSPEASGIIKEIYVTEGQWVNSGALMAKLNTDVLQRSIEEIEIQLSLATTNYKRLKTLWEQNIGSEMQLLQAKNNKESLEKKIESLQSQIAMAKIKSPISGIVDDVYQEKGNIASPQVPFAKVVNLKQLKIYGNVSESYLTKVHTGDKVIVSFPAIDRKMEATIRQIGNTIDPNNRTFRIRLNINNPDRLIKPNLIAVIRIRDYKAENAIVVPSLLIKQNFKGNYTYIIDKENGKSVAKRVYVTTGVTDNNMTEITKGLQPGDKIISEGFNQIADGSIVQY
ncbi:MAG: efflux transporter periplasmic adaptor subunit [Draconibacterium sp.]|nr:MAG: efflux transporter periplasmic adaptor subunit [Draconibacterium sp.]